MIRVPSRAFASCPPQVKRQASPKASGEGPLFLYDFGRIHQRPREDCLESPDGLQTGAALANIEGRGERIFAVQASDLVS